MALLMYSLVRRHMKLTGRYLHEAPPMAWPASVAPDAEVFAWYQSSSPDKNEALIFSETAVYVVCGDAWRKILWAEIDEYETPEKANPLGVEIMVKGERILLPAAGKIREGSGRDAFSLLQVVRAVVRHHRL
jgi:hypothetical protein